MAQVLIFGDSITFGAWDTEGGWAQRLKKHLHRKVVDSGLKNEYKPYVLGVSGDNTEDLLARIEPEITARIGDDEDRLVVFAIGINDSQFLHNAEERRISPEQFKTNLESLAEIAQKYAKRIAWLGLTPVDETKTTPISWNTEKSYRNEYIREYDAIIRSFASDNGHTYIPLFEDLGPSLMDDGLHPNTAGHQIIFQKVRQILEDLRYI